MAQSKGEAQLTCDGNLKHVVSDVLADLIDDRPFTIGTYLRTQAIVATYPQRSIATWATRD